MKLVPNADILTFISSTVSTYAQNQEPIKFPISQSKNSFLHVELIAHFQLKLVERNNLIPNVHMLAVIPLTIRKTF